MAYEARFNKNGNIKVGEIWTFNKLAGSGILLSCKGSCGEHCEGCYNKENPKKSPCYVFNSYVHYGWDKSTVVQAHVRNTNKIRNNIVDAFTELKLQINRAKNKPIAIRIHSSGEIETKEELLMWINLAKEFTNIPFYVYTKNYGVIHEVLTENNNLPNNFYINISIWHNKGIATYRQWKHINNIKAFVYMDNYSYPEDINPDVMCPAYNSKGKMDHRYTCDKCKICYNKNNKICGCYDH